jgi:hypothetical protein
MVTGIAVLGLNLLAGVWGGIAWARRDPSVWFWYVLRTAQVVVVAQVTLGLILLFTDHRARDDLHYVYGISLLVVTVVTEGMRAGAAQRELEDVEGAGGVLESLTDDEKRLLARRVVLREMGLMTIGALLITTLALRAATTGG